MKKKTEPIKSSSRSKVPQGVVASRNGAKFEKHIADVIVGWSGVKKVKYSDWDGAKQNVLVTGVPYVNIFGGLSKGQFLLNTPQTGGVRVECRWQSSHGSADSKLPYLMMNALWSFPEDTVLVLLECPAARGGAVGWCRRMGEAAQKKNVNVLSVAELKGWLAGNVPSKSKEQKKIKQGGRSLSLEQFVPAKARHTKTNKAKNTKR